MSFRNLNITFRFKLRNEPVDLLCVHSVPALCNCFATAAGQRTSFTLPMISNQFGEQSVAEIYTRSARPRDLARSAAVTGNVN